MYQEIQRCIQVVLQIVLTNMIAILAMSIVLATLGLLKLKVFWNKGYGVMVSVHDVTNKISSRDSNYILDVVTWLKFNSSSIPMREVIITSILTRKYNFWGLLLVQVFYTSMTSRLKRKVKVLGAIPMFVESAGEKLAGGFLSPSSWIEFILETKLGGDTLRNGCSKQDSKQDFCFKNSSVKRFWEIYLRSSSIKHFLQWRKHFVVSRIITCLAVTV